MIKVYVEMILADEKELEQLSRLEECDIPAEFETCRELLRLNVEDIASYNAGTEKDTITIRTISGAEYKAFINIDEMDILITSARAIFLN